MFRPIAAIFLAIKVIYNMHKPRVDGEISSSLSLLAFMLMIMMIYQHRHAVCAYYT